MYLIDTAKKILRLLPVVAAVLAAVVDPCAAQVQKPAVTRRALKAGEISGDRIEAIQAFLKILADFEDLLSQVNNEKRAEATAEKVIDMQIRIMKLNYLVGMMSMTRDEALAIQQKFGRKIGNSMQGVEKQALRLAKNKFYGSKRLGMALSAGMSHPYFSGRSLDGTPATEVVIVEKKKKDKREETIHTNLTSRWIPPEVYPDYLPEWSDRVTQETSEEFEMMKKVRRPLIPKVEVEVPQEELEAIEKDSKELEQTDLEKEDKEEDTPTPSAEEEREEEVEESEE